MRDHISLETIFGVQEQVLERVRREHSPRYEFAQESIELVINLKVLKEKLSGETKSRFDVIQRYQSDALSALINSLKLCLYGCISDSMMLLRVAVEDLAVMSYIVNTQSYKTTSYSPKRFKFEAIVKKVPEGDVVEELHGRLSDAACHTTKVRLKNSLFKLNEEWFPRVGVAYDSEGSRRMLGEIDRAALYLLRLLRKFFSQHAELAPKEFLDKVNEMDHKIETLKI